MTLKAGSKQLLYLSDILVNKVPVCTNMSNWVMWDFPHCMLWLPCTRLCILSLALYKIKQIGYLLAYNFESPSSFDKAYQVVARSYLDSKY